MDENSKEKTAAKVILPQLLSLKFPKRIRSFRAKGMFAGVCALLAVVILALGAYGIGLRVSYYSSLQDSLWEKADTAAEYFSRYVTDTESGYYQAARTYTENFEYRNSLELQFISAEGTVDISSSGFHAGESVSDADVTNALTGGSTSSRIGRLNGSGEKVLSVSAPLVLSDGSVVGVMRFISGLDRVNREITAHLLWAALAGAVVAAAVIFCYFYFLNSITEPIRSLSSIAKQVADGSYGSLLEKRYDDEIGELTDTINEMSENLKKSEKLQTEFISSVSHELRTPLTAITGWSETISYDESIQGDSRRGLEIITREAARLTKMVEELLEFTRMQDGRFTVQIETVNLPELVEDTLYSYRELFRQAGVEVAYSAPEEDYPDIPGDPARLRQVILNILDNACKYGHNGKRIEVSMKRTGDAQAVSVRDHGPGIPPEELPLVKRKFYKGSSKERGNGIGLAVCDEIVQRHHGILTIYNAEGGGLIVTITLPAKSS